MADEVKKVDIWTLIRKCFPVGEYALLQEVRNDAGFQASRSADGIAFGLWPSRGLYVHGIELKSFRNDWQKELMNPKKAEAIFKYCDFFWLVADNEKVVLDIGEIPPNWGYKCRKGSRLLTMKEAPKLTPEPLSRGFIAAMFKRATGGLIHPSQIQEQIELAVSMAQRSNLSQIDSLKRDHQQLENAVREFESAAGLSIARYHGASNLGKLVKIVQNHSPDDLAKSLRQIQAQVEGIKNTIDKSISELDALKVQPVNNPV